MTGSTRSVVATLAAMLLLAGCQPSSPVEPTPSSSPASPSPAPTPSFSCTPEAGGEQTPCSQAQYDEMKAKDKLYAEAESVFREYFAENIRISRAGGVKEPTEVLLSTTSGAFLADVMQIFQDMVERDLRAKGDDPTILIRRLPGVSKAGSVIALTVCVDATRWAFFDGDNRVQQGRPAIDEIYFGHVDGTLKAIGADGRWVDSCT